MGVWGVVRHRLRPPGPAHAPDSEAGRRLSCLEVVRVAGALLARQAGHGPQPADTQGPTLSPVAWEKGQEGLVQGAGREFRGPAFLPLPSPQLPVPPVIASTPISLSHTHTHARTRAPASISMDYGATWCSSQDWRPWSPSELPEPPALATGAPATRPHLVSRSKSTSSTKQPRCGINVPISCNPFSRKLNNLGNGSETWLCPGHSKSGINQAPASRLPVPSPSCCLSPPGSGG